MNQPPTTLPAWSDLLEDSEDDRLDALACRLAALDGPADEAGVWPEPLWAAIKEAEAPLWSIPTEFGGSACDRSALLQRYARVAEGSLTAAFILSQHDAAVRRIVAARDRPRAAAWLSRIARGEAFGTVGISHLTTSKRLGDRPMTAVAEGGRFRVDGALPWVTAAERADVLVTGAPLEDGRQVLVAVPTDRPGLSVLPSFPLAALQASCTTEVVCKGVMVEPDDVLAGPADDVMAHPGAAGTGGLETSALALGLARAAIIGLAKEAPAKAALVEPVEALSEAWVTAWRALNATALSAPGALAPGTMRGEANGLVLKATQAHLAARKGSGFLRTDPAQRWARQALFFLVWSCPGPVAQATIRDLAGLCPS